MRFLLGMFIVAASSAIIPSCLLSPCTAKLSERAEAILAEASREPEVDPSAIADQNNDLEEQTGDVTGSKDSPSLSRRPRGISKPDPSK